MNDTYPCNHKILIGLTFIILFRDSDNSSKSSKTVPSAVIFGAVGGALAVVAVAIVLIVVVTVVMIVTKGRKPNYQDATGKGTHTPSSRDSL